MDERLAKLSAQFEDIVAAQRAQQRQLADLANQIDELRSQLNRPSASYASPDDLKKLAEAIREVDRKRLQDNEKVERQLVEIANSLSSKPVRTRPKEPDTEPVAPSVPEKGYEYVVQQNDTLSAIVQAYREKNVKVTVDQVLKANPKLKPNSMRVGDKIFIPAP